MCGFVACFSSENAKSLDKKSIKAMTNTLYHRGPDDEGYYFDDQNRIALGHRRLSIIDLNNGHQPLLSSDKKVALVFNGEIYNHEEIRVELESKGVIFESRCDTEVLLQSWIQWGKDCLTKFNGMFSFVIVDFQKKTVFAARDRLGIKPLFWCFHEGVISFASELKALTHSYKAKLNLNSSAVKNYFTLGYIPDPNTISKAGCVNSV